MDCGKEFTWESQPVQQQIALGNLLTSAAILYSGSLPAKALRIFHILRCPMISTKTYFRHQTRYLQPAIESTWKQHQKEMLSTLKREKKKLILGGDGRADSPGHSAKYGTYSMMDLVHNKLIDFQIVQVTCYNSHNVYQMSL